MSLIYNSNAFFTLPSINNSSGFLVAVKEALEKPEELLMDGNVKKALEL